MWCYCHKICAIDGLVLRWYAPDRISKPVFNNTKITCNNGNTVTIMDCTSNTRGKKILKREKLYGLDWKNKTVKKRNRIMDCILYLYWNTRNMLNSTSHEKTLLFIRQIRLCWRSLWWNCSIAMCCLSTITGVIRIVLAWRNATDSDWGVADVFSWWKRYNDGWCGCFTTLS